MSKFNVENMLKSVKEAMVKVAEEKTENVNPPTEKTVEQKKEAMEKAIKEVSTAEKTASEKNPMDKVDSMIEKLAQIEKENLTKEAQMIGTALADAFVSRLQEHEKVAEEVMTQEKIAHLCETDPEFAASFQQGYMDKIAEELEKNPEAKKAFIENFEKQANELIKVGSYMQDKGYVSTAKAVEKFSNKTSK